MRCPAFDSVRAPCAPPQWLRRGGKELATPAPPANGSSTLTGFAAGSTADCSTPISTRKASRSTTRCVPPLPLRAPLLCAPYATPPQRPLCCCCLTDARGSYSYHSRRSSPNGKSAQAAAAASAAAEAAAAAAASAATFSSGILPSIPLLEVGAAPVTAATEEQQLLLNVTAPLHGDGMAMLLHPIRAATPTSASGLLGSAHSSYSSADGTFPVAQPTHTVLGVPVASLVADGDAAAVASDGAADFEAFARNVWPSLGSGRAE